MGGHFAKLRILQQSDKLLELFVDLIEIRRRLGGR
jgi:hypothetical protein